jgi:cell division transport system permease protein
MDNINVKKFKKHLKRIKLRIFGSYLISTISITFVLIFSGIAMLLVFNAVRILNKAKESIQITIIFKPNARESDILYFQKQLDSKPYTYYTQYISKSQALEEMKSYLGSDFIDLLKYNPLPPVIHLYLKAKYSNYDFIQKLQNYLLQQPLVDDVFFNRSLIYQLSKNVKTLTTILSVISLLFVLIAIVLIYNTIRLVIYSKRKEIKIKQLHGASQLFILKPFLLNAGLQGLISGLIADSIIVVSLLFIQAKSSSPVQVYQLELTLVLVLILGIVITTVSTFFAVNYYLSAKDEQIWT